MEAMTAMRCIHRMFLLTVNAGLPAMSGSSTTERMRLMKVPSLAKDAPLIGNLYRIMVLVLFLAWPGFIVQAQSGAGSIQGTVTDSTGGAIPDATVEVRNVATGVVTDTKSNNVGFYQVPDLFTGTYSLKISVPEMKTFATSIELLVGQKAVINPVLTAGRVTQEITVNADTVQLTDNESGTLASTLENSRIDQIPMNGRQLFTLTQLTTPGMEDSGQKVNGLAVEGTAYLLDGVSTMSTLQSSSGQTPMTTLIDPDSIQEVRVETGNSSAEFSAPATALVSTKSGTNQLHGSLFETARNNAFGVSRRREDPINYKAPQLIRNEFGASAGGPLFIPHFYDGRNKTFWFFAFERYSLAQSASTLSSVPTMAMRQGDFSGLYNGSNILQTLYDPATTQANSACAVPNSTKTANNTYCRTPYSNNTIPTNQISPLASVYYKLVPQPTLAGANPLVTSNLTGVAPVFQTVPQETFRIDHVFSDKPRTYLRYSHVYSNVNTSGGPRNLAVNDSGVNIPSGAAFGYQNLPSNQFIAGFGVTHVFSPTFFSETILSQQWYMLKQISGFAPNVNYESMLGLPNNFGEVGFPTISSGMFGMGTSQQNNVEHANIISTVNENLTKTLGKHQMQFGGSIRHERDADKPNGVADVVNFGPNPVALYDPSTGNNWGAYGNTGNANGSVFIGSVASFNVNLQPPHTHYHAWQIAGYIQDSYHVSPKLTANIGLRYEARPALWTKDGLVNTFDLKNDAMVLGTTPENLIAKGYTTKAIITNDEYIGVKFETAQDAGMPSVLMRNYNLNFFPRVGLAYLPFGSKAGTVIRGAYGRYAYANPLEDYANKPERNNPFNASYTMSYATAAQAKDGQANEYLRYNGPATFGVAGENTANKVDTTSTTALLPGIAPYSVDPAWAPTFATEVNFTVEQPLKGYSVVRASYVWTHATNLDISLMYNNQPSLYQWEMATGKAQPNGGVAVIGTPSQNTYSTTAMGPYDQTTWGNGTYETKAGWSNYNAIQVNYQRLFHHGYAYQFAYVFSKAMRTGGNQLDAFQGIDPLANYPGIEGTVGTMTSPYGPTVYPGNTPPAAPAGTPLWAAYHNLIKYEQYQQDNAQPTMRIRFNWVVDLPVGRGKKFFGNANRFVDELIGGFQFAGDGHFVSDLVQPISGGWGATNPMKTYKHKYPVTDCTSGICYKEYLWFNGYQAPTSVNGIAYGACTPTATAGCITGMPADYAPTNSPIDNTPKTTYYQQDEVQVTAPALNSGKPVNIAYDAGPNAANYMAKRWTHGPINWPMDMSLFKVFPITEKVNLRVNLDAFNALNMPGENDPGTGGLQKFLTSANSPRQLQISARLTF